MLQRARQVMHERFGALDDLPLPVADTIANYCSRWALFTENLEFGIQIVDCPQGGAPPSPEEYRARLEQALQRLGAELAELRAVGTQRGKVAFSRSCRLFLDRYKYGIAEGALGAPFRRIFSRLCGRTAEIPGLYRMLKAEPCEIDAMLDTILDAHAASRPNPSLMIAPDDAKLLAGRGAPSRG